MTMSSSLIRASLAGILLLGSAMPSLAAAESTTADWPCVQRKVPTLSAAQMWDGPNVEGVRQDDAQIRKLVSTLASRRVPMQEAVAALKEFAGKLPAGEKDARLAAVFAGLLATVNTQRTGVLAGIERFQQRQRQRSAEIEREGERLSKLKEKQASDARAHDELKQAQELFDWNVRIFQERQSSMPIACEVPVLMEERLFEMAREIRALMTS